MPPNEGDVAPCFEALLCDGESFYGESLSDVLTRDGGVLVFFGFVFNAISVNWWKRYDKADWGGFDVPVYGIGRDGPYAMNEFLRQIESPFKLYADVDGEIADAYDLLVERDGMAGARTARRAVFVLDGDREVQYRWDTDEWIYPVPLDEIEAAVTDL